MSVLGTTVFQVPKLGETGFKLDQVNEQKKRAAQQQLEKQVAATGAEKAYMDNAMGLTGKYKQIADASYDTFRQAAIQFEQTGSASDETRMKQAAAQLNYSVSAGRAILNNASDEYVSNKSNGFKNVSISPTESSELYSGFINQTAEVITKNGVVMIKDGDVFVPAVQSTHLSSSVNLNNSFMLPRTVQQGKFVKTEAFVQDNRNAISQADSVKDAVYRYKQLYNNKWENDAAFVSDVLTSYAINKLGKSDDPNKIDVDTYQEIQNLASDENIMADAREWYLETVLAQVPPMYGASTSAGRGGVAGTGTSLKVLKDETISFTPLIQAGDKFIVDDTATEEQQFDTYAGLESKLQLKGRTDAKKYKYDIVGIGIKDGVMYADKQASEPSGFWSTSSGRQYTRKAEPMTGSEFSGLPESTRKLIVSYFGGGSESNIDAMLSGKAKSPKKSVSSQGGTKTQTAEQTAQELREKYGY